MRILGLDLGTKTLGIAVSDKTCMIASNVTTLRFEEEKYETIIDEIDRQYAIVKESAEYDATLWPILDIYLDRYGNDPNREKKLTVEQSVENMKTYYQAKFQYMDSYFSAY